MDWIGLLGIAFGGTSLVGVVWGIIYFKPRSRIENLNAKQKDVEVAEGALSNLATLNEQLAEAYDKINKMGKRLDDQRNLIRQHEKTISRLETQISLLIEIAERQIDLKKYAESHICSVVECRLRKPPLGVYKSSSDSKVLTELISKLKVEEVKLDSDYM